MSLPCLVLSFSICWFKQFWKGMRHCPWQSGPDLSLCLRGCLCWSRAMLCSQCLTLSSLCRNSERPSPMRRLEAEASKGLVAAERQSAGSKDPRPLGMRSQRGKSAFRSICRPTVRHQSFCKERCQLLCCHALIRGLLLKCCLIETFCEDTDLAQKQRPGIRD